MIAQAVMSPSSLRFLSANVNGLGDQRKRASLFHSLAVGPWNVVALQETHVADDAAAAGYLLQGEGPGAPWRGQAYWSHGNSASRGVAILLGEHCPLQGVSVGYRDTHGRILRLDAQYFGTPISIVCVYAPSERDERPHFFQHHLPLALPDDGRPCIVGGDWNCVLDSQDVVCGGAGTRKHGSVQLRQFQQLASLYDVWREANMHASMSTHTAHHGSGMSAARLDRWLLHASLKHWVLDAATVQHLPGDHTAVSITLSHHKAPMRGNGSWCLPLHLLADAGYQVMVRQTIQAHWDKYPVSPSLGHGSRWDHLKQRLSAMSISYSKDLALQRKSQQRALNASVEMCRGQFMAQPCSQTAETYEEARKQLQAHCEALALKTADTATLLWQYHGERGSGWFHRLGRESHAPSVITTLEGEALEGQPPPIHDLSTQDGKEAGGAVLADFYGGDHPRGLFVEEPCDEASQQLLLSSIDRTLSPEDAHDAEGPSSGFLVSELTDALAALPHGTRPGHDGLPYEFYRVFWPELKEELGRVAEEAFNLGVLPASMQLGLITLLYKGKGLPTTSAASYRPLTMLCCDYKILARAMVKRIVRPLDTVVDLTQTGFLPGRWIGDNTMFHIEEVDYLQRVQSPGCIVFLDFEKAYDRVDRGWLYQCMTAFGFGPRAVAGVRLMLQGTCASVLYNGHRSRTFPVNRGLAQGSPLSPLLYVLIAQPLASRLRKLQQTGMIHGITMPDGLCAPMSHQHADDTAIHTRSVLDASYAIEHAVVPFCKASSQRLNRSKSNGLTLGSHPEIMGLDHHTGAVFLPNGQYVRHLGVLLGRDMSAASEELWKRRLTALRRTASIWSKYNLSHLGRVHIAKTVLAAQVYYHATVSPPSPACMKQLEHEVERFICSKVTLADGGLPMSHPGKHIASLPVADGGIGQPDVKVQVRALQAKVAMAAMHPTPRPWKALFMQGLHMAALPSCIVAPVTAAIAAMDPTKAFAAGHLTFMMALRAARPHRASMAPNQEFHGVMRESLVANAQVLISPSGATLGQADVPECDGARVVRVGDLRSAMQRHPQHVELQLLCDKLPAQWRAHVLAPHEPVASFYCTADQGEVWAKQPFGLFKRFQVHRDRDLGDCDEVGVEPPPLATMLPCCVLELGPHICKRQVFFGPFASLQFNPAAWRCGSHSIFDLTPRDARCRMLRLRVLQGPWAPLYQRGVGLRPPLWPESVDEPLLLDRHRGGLEAVEKHWRHILTHRFPSLHTTLLLSPAGPAAPRGAPVAAYDASWMHPSSSRQLPMARAAQQPPTASSSMPRASRRVMPPSDVDPLAPSIAASSPGPSVGAEAAQQESALVLPGAATPPGTSVGAEAAWEESLVVPLSANPPSGPPIVPPMPPAMSDDADPLLLDGAHVSHRQVWQRLHCCKELPREAVSMAWRVLHGQLYCGAFWARVRETAQLTDACCVRPTCVKQLDTLSHMFVECPSIVPALEWLLDVWHAVSGNRPPKDARVVVADDHRVWQPQSPTLRHAWTVLRVLYLHAVWRCAVISRMTGKVLASPAIIAMVVRDVRRVLQCEWARVLDGGAALAGSVPLSAESQPLAVAAFKEKWCMGEVLACVQQEGVHCKLCLKFTSSWPVAIPA
jgi:exonuclease III